MTTIVAAGLFLAIVPFAIGLGIVLTAAEKRGWLRQGKVSASSAFSVAEELFSPSASQSRQELQEQKRIGQRAPTPGGGLDDGPSLTGRYAGKLTVSVSGSNSVTASPSGRTDHPSGDDRAQPDPQA
jgi:hypothetical protein